MPNIKTQLGGFGSSGAGTSPVTSSRRIDTTTPLQGGGDLSADRTLSIDTATLLSGIPTLAGTNVFTGPNYFTGFVNLAAGGASATLGDVQVSGILRVYDKIGVGQFPTPSHVIHLSNDGPQSVTSDTYGNQSYDWSLFTVRRAAGTFQQASGIDQNLILGGIAWQLWGGTGTAAFSDPTDPTNLNAGIVGVSKSRDNETRQGVKVNVYTTTSGDTAATLRLTLDSPSVWAVNQVALDVQTSGVLRAYDTTHFGSAGSTAIFRGGNVLISSLQVSGQDRFYDTGIRSAPMYQGSVSASTRYVVSGEMPAIEVKNYAVRDEDNFFVGAKNVFNASVTLSGGATSMAPLYQGSVSAASRYVVSGELGAVDPNTAVRNVSNFFTGPVNAFSDSTVVVISGNARFGSAGNTRISASGDIQASGIVIAYSPVYQGAIAGASRYVTSGELAQGGSPDAAVRTANNFFTATNVFAGNTTFSGQVIFANGGFGSSLVLASQSRLVTLSGTATVTVTGMMAGNVWGVTTLNVTQISGGNAMTGINIGISGVHPQRTYFGINRPFAQGTTSTYVNYGLSQTPVFSSPTPIQLQVSGGDRPFAGGQMRLVSYYMEISPPTS